MSSDKLHDDTEFERFLAGEDELSRQLKGLAQAEPPAELDAAVFARIEAAMAAEKVQTVETGPASNDPVGPPAVPLQRKKNLARSLAYYWHWPVGVAAGILAVLAYRTAFEPNQPAQLASNDTNMRVIVPTPHVTEPADVVTVPSRATTAPAVIEPPDVPAEPTAAAPAAVSAQPLVASAKEAAPATAAHADAKASEVTVTGSRINRIDSTSARPSSSERVDVITASEIAKLPEKTVADEPAPAAKPESGVELAWTHDPAQDARDSLASNYSRAKPSASPALPPPPPPAAVMAAPADVAARAPSPALVASAPAAAAPAGYSDARTVAPTAAVPAELAKPEVMERQVASADAQETQRKKMSVDRARTNPRRWLALIEQEIKDKQDQAALAEWDKFVAAYPTYKVKDKLRTDIDALRARSPARPDSAK